MTLQVARALGSGLTKTLSKAGLTFVLLIGIVQLGFISATNTMTEAFLASLDVPTGTTGTSAASQSIPLSLPVSATVAGVLAVVALLLLQILTIVLVRTMAADRQVITREMYTRRMVWVTINSIVAAIVLGVLTMIGFVLLVIPGLFLTVSLLFATIYIADEDKNVITAMRNSWELASGNRWRLLGLYLLIIIGSMAASFAFGLVLPSETIFSQAISAVLSTVLIVYLMAVLTDAYRQLRTESGDRNRTEPSPDVTST